MGEGEEGGRRKRTRDKGYGEMKNEKKQKKVGKRTDKEASAEGQGRVGRWERERGGWRREARGETRGASGEWGWGVLAGWNSYAKLFCCYCLFAFVCVRSSI